MGLPAIRSYTFDAEPFLGENVTSWRLEARRSALLVHDMQEHFVGVFERGRSGQIDLAVGRIRQLIDAAHRAGVPVVYTAQPPAQDPADRALLTDFWGPGLRDPQAADIIAELAPTATDDVLTKWRYSAFYRSDLGERMSRGGRDQLVIAGVYAHIGCLTTALVAFMDGIQTFFAADAMADFGAQDHEMATRYVARRCGQVVSTTQVVTAFSAPADEQRQGASLATTAGGR